MTIRGFLFLVPPPEFWLQLKQAGKNWGSLRGKIFASLLTASSARLGWERLRSLAPSREAKQNIFQFLLEENFARASLKEKERNVLFCAAVRWAEPQGGVCARQGADCRLKKFVHFQIKRTKLIQESAKGEFAIYQKSTLTKIHLLDILNTYG